MVHPCSLLGYSLNCLLRTPPCSMINKANLLLMTPAPNGRRLWRLRHAPEASLPLQLLMGGLAAALLLSHLLLCVATSAALMLLPLAFSCVGVWLLSMYAIGRPVPQRPLMNAVIRGEVLLSAALTGMICTHVPPPPIFDLWDF